MKSCSKQCLAQVHNKQLTHTLKPLVFKSSLSFSSFRLYSNKNEQSYLHVVGESNTGINRVEHLSNTYKTNTLYPSLTNLKKELQLSDNDTIVPLGKVSEINPETTPSFYIMGQLTAKRDSGKKAHFFKIKQYNDEYDLVAHWSRFPLNSDPNLLPDFHTKFNSLKIGDHVLFKVEKSVNMKGVTCLRPLEFATMLSPRLIDVADVLVSDDKAMNNKVLLSLNEKEMYRHRELIDSVLLRSRLNKLIRNFLDNEGFIEVETPILNLKSGGANATPFTTKLKTDINKQKQEKINDNNELQLRIAPELWLKRLVVAGYDSIYELGKNFRNEGVDMTHNPEFTSLEIYKKYYDLEQMISLGERILKEIYILFEKELGETKFNAFKKENFKFKRVDCIKQLSIDYEIDLDKLTSSLKLCNDTDSSAPLLEILQNSPFFIENFLKDSKTKMYLENISIQTLLKKLIDQIEIDHCNSLSPTILTNHPGLISPLAKQDEEGVQSFRYELFIEGVEYMNAYEEQNDPEIQNEQFMKQQKVKDDDETMSLDSNYVKTMKYGLGPTAGLGVGIDRLLMMISSKKNIASVLSFGNLENVKRQ